MMLNQENVANSILMIQPSLVSYAINSAPEPAPLDAASVAADRVLLLDSYFTIVVFHGATVAQCRKSGYQDMLDHKVGQILYDNIQEHFGFSVDWCLQSL